jgi:hypothetical protein
LEATHERVEAPEPWTDGGVRVQRRPTGEEADAERPTLSEKPFTAFTLIVEVPLLPALIAEGETSAADIPKSATLTVI